MLDPLGSAFYVVRKVVGESRGDGDEVAVFWEGYCEARHGDSWVRVSMGGVCTYVKFLWELRLHDVCKYLWAKVSVLWWCAGGFDSQVRKKPRGSFTRTWIHRMKRSTNWDFRVQIPSPYIHES